MTIIKKVTKPIFLWQMDALLQRLPGCPKRKRIETERARTAAGLRGEQTIEYFAKEITGPSSLFHDIRLRLNYTSFFQIDCLILTPCFLVISESKNYIGKLSFETENKQTIQTFEGHETVLPDPILQLRRQSRHLTDWLHKNNLPQMPVFSYVVLSHPSNRISITPSNRDYERRIIRSIEIPETIHSLFQKNKNPYLNEQQFQKASSLIAKSHIPYEPDIFRRFNITADDIQKGIFCPLCSHPGMVRHKRNWLCLSCKHTSKSAHNDALRDYYLLFGKKVTNKEFARFISAPSLSVSYRILKSAHAKEEGGDRNRIYILPDRLIKDLT
ncbi:hypothetical protein BTO30_10730 [Domibacillus antri]|uniref:NERD domain-containing protein n=1 Tax=Domibacillus antri TaxID=1714264 RepID=A0A1Q8Q4K4_9BACI|nr:nuclease-related domain-containing protein [Domibacillus antri]OLN22215.1 hypothetical protein BTO30_10730 [Domibacillus antri]